MANFMAELVQSLQNIGVYEYFLPFLLIFAVIFAILEKINLFGKSNEPRTNINVVVAIIFGLIVMVQTDITLLINAYLSKMALFIIIIMVLLLAIGVFGGGGSVTKSASGLLVILSIVAVIWALSPSIGLNLPRWLDLSPDGVKIIILLGAAALAMVFVARSPNRGNRKSFGEGMKDLLGDIGSGFKGES